MNSENKKNKQQPKRNVEKLYKELKGLVVLYFVEDDTCVDLASSKDKPTATWLAHEKIRESLRNRMVELIKNN